MAPDAPGYLVRKVFALLKNAHVTERRDRLRLYQWVLRDLTIMSTDHLSQADLETVAHTLSMWQHQGELESRARQVVSQQAAWEERWAREVDGGTGDRQAHGR